MTDTPCDSHFSKPLAIRLLLARPRLFSSIAIGVATTWLLPDALAQHTVTRAIIGWNVGAILYLALAMLFGSTHERMRARALQQDEGLLAVDGGLDFPGAAAGLR